MTASHRIALKTLLDGVRDLIVAKETALLNATDGNEQSKLVEELTDLQLRKQELIEAISGTLS